MLRWRMFIEEYDVTLHFIPGVQNTCADYFSRVMSDPEILEGKSAGVEVGMDTCGPAIRMNWEEPRHQDIIVDDCELALYILKAHESYINVLDGTVYPMSYESIQKSQMQNTQLCDKIKTEPGNYTMEKVTSDVSLIFYKNKICIPADLARSILQWYHNALTDF